MKSTNYSHKADIENDIAEVSTNYSTARPIAQTRRELRAEKLRLERFGLQIKAWRLRARMTQSEAGMQLAKDSGEIKEESAKRLWIRIEQGLTKQNPEKLKRITDIVSGTPELAQAVQDGCFEINSESVFHDCVKNLPEQHASSLSETLSDSSEELQDFLKNGENRGTTLMYLLGQRERKCQLQRDKDLFENNKDLSLKLDEITFEDCRNRVIDEFFGVHMLPKEEKNHGALNDLWLSVFRNGEDGIAYLRQIERIYSKCFGVTKNVNAYIYKNSIHLASLLLFHLYDCQPETISFVSTKSNKVKSTLGANGLKFDSIESIIELIPRKKRRGIKEEFAAYLYSYDTFREIDDIGAFRKEATPREFEIHVLSLVKQISHMEFENEHNPVSEARSVRKYSLYRLYHQGTPQEFLNHLWFMLDTFELYKIKFKQAFPGEKVTYIQS